MGFQRYVDYALDVPMYFVYRDGEYIDALGQSFRDFLAGKLPALPGQTPTMSDWADHLTTCFPRGHALKNSWKCAVRTAARGGAFARCLRSGLG